MAQEASVKPVVKKPATNESNGLGNVPLHVFEKIVRRMDPHSVFEVSLISEPFLDKVRAFKYVAEYANWTIHPTSKKLEIATKEDVRLKFLIQCSPGDEELDKLNAKGVFGPITREEDEDARSSTVTYYFPREHDQMGLFKELTQHVLSIFKVKKFQCFFHEVTALRELFMWNYTKTFFFFGLAVSSTNAEQMNYLLENGKFTNLHLNTNVQNLHFAKQISTTNLEINNVKWLGTDNILNYGCRSIEIGELEFGEFNTILKNWLSKENDSLETMNGSLRDAKNALFDGITTQPSVFDISDYRLRIKVSNANPVDIQRSTDDRFATIFVSESSFQIMVWHPKHLKYCSRPTRRRFGLIKD